ncbi:N-acetylmuramoyl-L-alanine amidase CwlD [Schnuerera sp. xch1]|uniref:N-acetylmuramoyl-L-alanine amidase CwlD n=1 Tax=Schnuerera sp. xch1 TaxID=2874283 RepID=UPI001CC113A2|nr:N-acetylmuramoyl-L-alanine amidase CwlD [Schnuerera sp. xch1]MBZ2175270.1 N-acetylmuramoyl-L-alanine amidase CwlD [Schnuerera sp. xch1]
MKVIYITKRNLYVILSIILISITILLIALFNNRVTSAVNVIIGQKIIGIDPGHGGIDSGAVGVSGIEEDKINLKIALKLKRIIEQNGGTAVMTRENEDGLYTDKSKTLKEKKTEDLHNRKKIIESANCDVFISIHLNSFEQSMYYGAQTFYGKDKEYSYRLAHCIQNQLKNELDKNNQRVPQDTEEVFLLNEIQAPSVLVECGFVSNPEEERLLNTDGYQGKIALAIYNGIMKYFIEDDESNKL